MSSAFITNLKDGCGCMLHANCCGNHDGTVGIGIGEDGTMVAHTETENAIPEL